MIGGIIRSDFVSAAGTELGSLTGTSGLVLTNVPWTRLGLERTGAGAAGV